MVKMTLATSKWQRGSVLKLIFSLAEVKSDHCDENFNDHVSDTFNINDLAEVRFQFKRQSQYYIVSFSYKKHKSEIDYTIKMNITRRGTPSLSLPPYSKQCVCPENFSAWEIICTKVETKREYYELKNQRCDWKTHSLYLGLNVLEVTLNVFKVKTITFPTKFYEDEEFCDFHLMTTDGVSSVPVHKACLVLHSNMFRTMLNGEWKETINGCLKIEGVTLQTLKHLKEYFYLGTLPDDTVQLQLLLQLAQCYMADNLKTECIVKIAETVKPEDLYSLQDFAVENHIPELLRAILQMTPDETVQSASNVLMENEKDGGDSAAKKKKSDDGNVI